MKSSFLGLLIVLIFDIAAENWQSLKDVSKKSFFWDVLFVELKDLWLQILLWESFL